MSFRRSRPSDQTAGTRAVVSVCYSPNRPPNGCDTATTRDRGSAGPSPSSLRSLPQNRFRVFSLTINLSVPYGPRGPYAIFPDASQAI